MKKLTITLITLLFSFVTGTAQPESLSARHMQQRGLINIQSLDPNILVDLMYAKADNFVGRILYTDLKEAYLHPEAANALIKAQKLLKAIHPSYRLIVYDATRPMSIQQQM